MKAYYEIAGAEKEHMIFSLANHCFYDIVVLVNEIFAGAASRSLPEGKKRANKRKKALKKRVFFHGGGAMRGPDYFPLTIR